MSVLFFAHATLLNASRSSRTNLYAPDTQHLAPCLNKNYSLIMINAFKKALRRILKKNTCSNRFVFNRLGI